MATLVYVTIACVWIVGVYTIGPANLAAAAVQNFVVVSKTLLKFLVLTKKQVSSTLVSDAS
jgi:hypothetical protein